MSQFSLKSGLGDNGEYAQMCNESFAKDLLNMRECLEYASKIFVTHMNHTVQSSYLEHLVFFDCLKVAMMEKHTLAADAESDQTQQTQFILQNNVIEELMTRFAEYAEITLNNLEKTMSDSSAILCEAEYVGGDSSEEDVAGMSDNDDDDDADDFLEEDESQPDSNSNRDLDCECRYCQAVKTAATNWLNFQPRTVMESIICENLKKHVQ